MIFGVRQADAAFGDCISWIWGGKNESTTYSPPYSPAAVSTDSDSNQNGGQAASQSFWGQSAGSATPVYVTSPSYTDARPDEYFPSSHFTRKPVVSNPATELRPTVKREWTYSPITSVAYKPVQQIDPQTGQVSTYYRAEESKTLLPWLHRKETIEYKPVLVPSGTRPAEPLPASVSGPQIVQANYAGPQTYVVTAAQTPYFYDPCGNLVRLDTQRSEPIPMQTTGDLILSQSPNASSTVSTFVSQNTGGRDVNYGIPPVREGYEPGNTRAYSETTPASAADQPPVIDYSIRRPDTTPQPLISEADLRPVHPYTETVEKPETAVMSSSSITTPVPDLPIVKLKKEVPQKLVSPTQVYRKSPLVDAR